MNAAVLEIIAEMHKAEKSLQRCRNSVDTASHTLMSLLFEEGVKEYEQKLATLTKELLAATADLVK